MRILFIDDRPAEIIRLIHQARLGEAETAVMEPADDVDGTLQMIAEYQPQVIVIGHGLGPNRPNGDQIVQAILYDEFDGHIVCNSGGGALQWATELPYHANRQPDRLRAIVVSFSEPAPDSFGGRVRA